MGGDEPQPGDKPEQQDEYDQRGPVHVLHGIPPIYLNVFPCGFLFVDARRR
jgi:hypothetical protein